MRELSSGADIRADICIIGSGPAGIAAALEFDGLPVQVAVLEAGGQDAEAPVASLQRLAPGSAFARRSVGMPGRQLGGNSSLWGVATDTTSRGIRLTPLTAADFDRHAWMKDSGWPVTAGYFSGYYERALRFFDLPQDSFLPEDWQEDDARPLPLAGRRIRTRMFQFAAGETVWKQRLGALIASRNITVYAHASALELVTDQAGARVRGVCIASGPGEKRFVHAGQVIVAAGGLWSTQLLLASDSVVKGGLGAAGGHLGRHFHTHPLIRGGYFHPASQDMYAQLKLYDLRTTERGTAMGHLQLTDEALRGEALHNLCAMLYPMLHGVRLSLTRRQRRGFEAARRINQSRINREPISMSDVLEAMIGIDGFVRVALTRKLRRRWDMDVGGWSRMPDLAKVSECFEVLHISEQAPHPDNRLTLAEERDALGMRKLYIDWAYRDEDAAAVRRSQMVFAEELAAAGLGRFEILSEDGRPVIYHSHANHYFGTTRMSQSPDDGVVDTDARVHGVDNLYVASTSVFPTSGFANPTLTVVALAKRVADVVKARAASAGQDAGLMLAS